VHVNPSPVTHSVDACSDGLPIGADGVAVVLLRRAPGRLATSKVMTSTTNPRLTFMIPILTPSGVAHARHAHPPASHGNTPTPGSPSTSSHVRTHYDAARAHSRVKAEPSRIPRQPRATHAPTRNHPVFRFSQNRQPAPTSAEADGQELGVISLELGVRRRASLSGLFPPLPAVSQPSPSEGDVLHKDARTFVRVLSAMCLTSPLIITRNTQILGTL
jgi:hypothetical protein